MTPSPSRYDCGRVSSVDHEIYEYFEATEFSKGFAIKRCGLAPKKFRSRIRIFSVFGERNEIFGEKIYGLGGNVFAACIGT